MSCTRLTDDGLVCGEEALCDSCFEAEMRDHLWMRGLSYGAATGHMDEQDDQDMRDAGRLP